MLRSFCLSRRNASNLAVNASNAAELALFLSSSANCCANLSMSARSCKSMVSLYASLALKSGRTVSSYDCINSSNLSIRSAMSYLAKASCISSRPSTSFAKSSTFSKTVAGLMYSGLSAEGMSAVPCRCSASLGAEAGRKESMDIIFTCSSRTWPMASSALAMSDASCFSKCSTEPCVSSKSVCKVPTCSDNMFTARTSLPMIVSSTS
mmetsp:Transcript_58869/g.137529  ORF Transcript_58869/g.137529 Transcript_58869/m.137529 type:complete len:208 (-) Transcript_58869:219-842(-)